ncbi:MAG: T9SS type A sorting domain-containing protein [Flavobacteriia bacterium]|nr:T9SS type A sorting domain-containing protein [Flavobacteriia bacterium]
MRSFLIIIFIYTTLYSQININYQRNFGGNLDDHNAVILESPNDNGFYMLNYTNSTTGELPSLFGSYDIWLIKLDDNYQIVWQKSYGGVGYDIATDMIIINDNIYIVGESELDGTGNITVDSYGETDTWLLALDLDGNILWQKNYGGENFEFRQKISTLQNGNLIISCLSDSDSSGNKTTSRIYGNEEIWLIEVDINNGSIIQEKGVIYIDWVGKEYNFHHDTIRHRLFLSYNFADNVIIGDKTTESNGQTDVWVLVLDEQLNKLYDKNYGGIESEFVLCSFLFDEEYTYLLTSSNSDVSGNKTTPIYGSQSLFNYDIWLIKLDNDLNIVEQKSYGSFDSDKGHQIVKGKWGNFSILGISSGGINGIKTQDSFGENDSWLLILDQNLNVLTQGIFGGSLGEGNSKLILNDNGDVILYIKTESDISGNKTTPFLGGYSDIWLIELETSELLRFNTILDNYSNKAFPNPFNNQIQIDVPTDISEIYLKIVNIEGQIIYEQSNYKGEIIQVEGNSQIYFYEIKTKSGLINGKLVKL